MGWTLTSVSARIGTALGLRRRWRGSAFGVDGQFAAAPSTRDDVFARAYARRVAAATPADRKALEAARAEMADDAAILERAVATGARVSAVAELAATWESLGEPARAVVRSPVGDGSPGAVSLAGVPAVQVDQTTCGAASMAVMLMMGDPFVALWVATGRHVDDFFPVEALVAEVETRSIRTVEERWRALQRVLHEEVTRFAVGPLPWPRRFGTPPWRVDNVTRFAGLRFRGAMIDDSDPQDVAALMGHATAALRDRIPVPMYVGGDSSGGLSGVVPRHVVLLVGRTPDGFLVYEPSSGRVHALDEAAFYAGGTKQRALGNWTRVCWLVLPRPRSR